MGYKKLSNEEEMQIVEEYRQGIPVNKLMAKYGYATKKSITDKVKKYYPDSYKDIIKEAQDNRKGYKYKLEKISCEFDAYYIGLMLTDGYVSCKGDIGIDLVDEDCIAFLSKTIGKDYHTYAPTNSENSMINGKPVISKQNRHRLILQDKELEENLKRFNIIPNKTKILTGPTLLPEEEKYIPYIIRGIIDGDGSVSPTSYGAPQFRIVSYTSDFCEWIAEILVSKMYMIDIKVNKKSGENLYFVNSADQGNILKLISMSYNKPFGMQRKYKKLRETFRDYNGDFLLK